MVRTFIGGRPPRNEMDEQKDTQLTELGLNDFRPIPRNLFVGGAEQDQLSGTDADERTPTRYATQPEHFQIPTGTRQRHLRLGDSQHERSERDAQTAVVVATRNSPALSNIVVPTKPRGSGKLNNEPSSSKHSEELMRKNVDLERQLRDVQKSIDELKSPRSHQQTLDLDSAPLNLSITAEPYQEGFKIPHLETYDGSGDPDEHLHTYQAIMRIQNANDAMMCKVFPTALKSTARRWEIKRTATELMQVHQKEGESLRDYMQRFNKATLDIDNVLDTICLSALLHGLRRGWFLDDLLENPSKTWNEVNDKSASFLLSEDFQSSKRRADDKQSKSQEQPPRREEKKKQKVNEQWGKPADFSKYANYVPLTLPRSQILAQIQYWIRRPPPSLHDPPKADKSKHCDYHHDNQSPSKQGRAYRGCQFNRRGQGQRPATQNQKDRRGVGCSRIPSPFGTINMISGGMHSGGQSARARKVYARQVMTVNQNKPLKRPFEEAEWENVAITFSPLARYSLLELFPKDAAESELAAEI
ncbi:hypothetical protein SLEP1_g9484 [Rubroshorea leprosula]|uniref:Retrotransposon gag domain-containing protein n=1 Tax=Rubroshorea leprosula TaxID=152421 RepID=A0AAV5IEZ2_9ROSI|nr:hypothetical protein SLEP1_g9484 [Rubroshorea leprosula]